MAGPTKDQVLAQLRKVNDPELHKDLVTLNMIKNIALCEGLVTVTVELTTPACPLKDQIRKDVVEAVSGLPDVTKVEVEFTAQVRPTPQQGAQKDNPLPRVKHIIAVGAGKGGVGKSTVAVNLAVGLARDGAAVGLLDADIYGPSLPTMMGLEPYEAQAKGSSFIPFDVHGVKCMTIGKIVEPEKPMILRGPMLQGAFKQLATQTDWGDLDYLIIDLPPGTGDIPLTMSQLLPLTGAVIVCTPQKVAQDDARRALRMFQQLSIEVLGVVENMSYFIADDGKEYDIFGKGGAQRMAQDMGVPFLAGIPINMALRKNSDSGDPTANFTGNDQLARDLTTMVRHLAGQVSINTMQHAGTRPTLTIN